VKELEQFLEEISKSKLDVDINLIKSAARFVNSIGYNINFDISRAVLKLKPDADSIAVSFFYDALDDIKESDIDRIRAELNSDISAFVENLKKLKDLSKTINASNPEAIRSMLVIMARDMRVILIWLSAMMVISEKIGDMPKALRLEFAKKCMDIFAPIAGRLGIYEIKHKIEDNAFKYINPAAYTSIYNQLKKFGKQKNKHINAVKLVLEKFLKENGIQGEVSGRIKSIYSIYRKLKAKNKTSIDDIFDVIAMRIVLPTQYKNGYETTEHLYSLLGLIHSKWTPVPNRFKDYLAIPKLNGYQSLHTTVLGILPKFLSNPVEIQIRSERMHEEAELGIATHWVYKECSGKNYAACMTATTAQKMREQWFKALQNLENIDSSQKDNAEIGILEDRIFVLTPKGDVKNFPAGSTVIDFAYSIHTDVGSRAYAAKANGVAVPLDYELKNGDLIEVILKPKPSPKIEWLGFVKTDYAKSRIRDWMKSRKRGDNFKIGKDIINKYLNRLGKPPLDDALSILKIYDGKELNFVQRKTLVEDVGSGAVVIKTFIKKLFPQPDALKPVQETQQISIAPKKKKQPYSADKKSSDIIVGGERGLPVKIALCCNPRKGTEIAGYVTKNGYIAIHDARCASLKRNIKNRIIPASWDIAEEKQKKSYIVKVIIEGIDRIGLFRDIATIIAEMNINIVDIMLLAKTKNFLKRAFILDVENYELLDKTMDKLEDVQGVSRVYIEGADFKSSV